MKRVMDIAGAVVLLLLMSPIMVATGLLVRLCIGPPVLFKQCRPGLNARPFTILKFRTMSDKKDGKGLIGPDHTRLTRLGILLRATSLDELPELINVLKGDMSLVGPRPLLMQYLDRYTAEQAVRHSVKPGLTGWVQVNGRNALNWEDKFKLDAWYVQNRSIQLDLKILVLTAQSVLKRDGISHVGEATMPEFTGLVGVKKV